MQPSLTARSVFIASLLLFLISVGAKASSPTKILIIGDSLLGENDMPKVFSAIAASRGDPADVLGHVPGLGMSVAKRVLTHPIFMQQELPSKAWDFAVIQENSELTIVESPKGPVGPYVKNLSEVIRQHNAGTRLAFLVTWGFKDGDTVNCAYDPVLCSYDSMQNALNHAYVELAQENAGIVVPVGHAWQAVRQAHPEIELYKDDHHPSPQGTYLAACVLYDVLFQKKSFGADPQGLDAATAAALQKTADAVVIDSHRNWYQYETKK